MHKDAQKLYENRRTLIYFSIWRLTKQIILNHGYIKKYYQDKDNDKNCFCELYQVQMVRWLMEEIRILNVTLEDQESRLEILNSLKYDYFGGIIILISLLKTEEAQDEVRIITHNVNLPDYECLMSFWFSLHSISHNIDYIGHFFKKSIIRSFKLRKRNRIKCQWRHCKKWKKRYKFYKCKKCKAVTYCSRNCQKKGWKLGHHRFVCNDYHRINI